MQVAQLQAELALVASVGTVEVRSATDVALSHDLTDVIHDSRQASAGRLFCAVPGLRVDGHDFAVNAAQAGASALLVERFIDASPAVNDLAQIKVPSVRAAMPHAAAIVHGHPSNDIALFGMTGTNGKTTTTHLLTSIARSAGRRCSVIGTLAGTHTTPESTELQRLLRSEVDAGTDIVALEVSSHALDQRRVEATRFAVAAFSNLTPDHLDYHGDMNAYFEAKKMLFDGRALVEIINVDDEWGATLASERPDAMALSLANVQIGSETIEGTSFRWRGHDMHVSLPGRMNVANALMAIEAALVVGIDEAAIVTGLRQAVAVPGRMERVPSNATSQPTVLVDYSHTPDSIERALTTVRRVNTSGAVTIVFGCGGDRDRSKRPLMGRAAELGADTVIVTSDNPRSEDPDEIIAQAVAGMTDPGAAIVEPDRREAIRRAIITAGQGDVILIAGKGHEKTQTIGDQALPFDDVGVAQELLETADS